MLGSSKYLGWAQFVGHISVPLVVLALILDLQEGMLVAKIMVDLVTKIELVLRLSSICWVYVNCQDRVSLDHQGGMLASKIMVA